MVAAWMNGTEMHDLLMLYVIGEIGIKNKKILPVLQQINVLSNSSILTLELTLDNSGELGESLRSYLLKEISHKNQYTSIEIYLENVRIAIVKEIQEIILKVYLITFCKMLNRFYLPFSIILKSFEVDPNLYFHYPFHNHYYLLIYNPLHQNIS
jgi:hypothetical protein